MISKGWRHKFILPYGACDEDFMRNTLEPAIEKHRRAVYNENEVKTKRNEITPEEARQVTGIRCGAGLRMT